MIGLALLQLLKSSDKTIVPLIKRITNYFKNGVKTYRLPVYSGDENLKLEATLVVDIAGQKYY